MGIAIPVQWVIRGTYFRNMGYLMNQVKMMVLSHFNTMDLRIQFKATILRKMLSFRILSQRNTGLKV